MTVKTGLGPDLVISRDAAGGVLYTAMRDGRPLGYVAIDSTVAGRSCGGLRMLPDVDEEEIKGLARAMTLKYGFLGLPQGGAKAGVLGDPEGPQTERFALLERFGRTIAPLLRSRSYVPGTDMGTDCAGIRYMLGVVGVPVARRDLRENSSGYYTACATMAGVGASARHVGLDTKRVVAAVEGFGKVGAPLAGLLSRAGARVVAISTSRGALYNPAGLDVERLTRLAREKGSRVVEAYPDAERIELAALHELPLDILCPCARHGSVNAGNASRIKARIICPGANNPVTPEAEAALLAGGVLCLPDFVTNSGGVLGGTMEFAGVGREEIAAFIDSRVGAAIGRILAEADRTGSSPRAIAVALSRERFARVKAAAERPTLKGRLFGAGLLLYRWGLIPSQLMKRPAMGYFRSLFKPSEVAPVG